MSKDSFDQSDDETGRRLRDALANEARAITPSADGLDLIREKIRARRSSGAMAGRRGARLFQIGAAGLATAAVVVVAAVVVHGSGHGSPGGVALPAVPPPASQVASSPTLAPATVASPVASSGATYPVPVYYVDARKDPQQLLFREITQWPPSPQHTFVKDAVDAMLTTPAVDPDYKSYWPAGTALVSVNITNDTTAVVDLSSPAAHGPAGEGAISAQQLLYTIIAAAPKISGLQLQINGVAVTSLWGSPLATTVAALPSWQVWGHVWITQPAENATVASSVTISGEATVDEGTVTYQILRTGDVLKTGTATATAGAPDRGTWSVTVDGLAPGPYTVRAYEVSQKDGSTTYVDDKAFTVQ